VMIRFGAVSGAAVVDSGTVAGVGAGWSWFVFDSAVFAAVFAFSAGGFGGGLK